MHPYDIFLAEARGEREVREMEKGYAGDLHIFLLF